MSNASLVLRHRLLFAIALVSLPSASGCADSDEHTVAQGTSGTSGYADSAGSDAAGSGGSGAAGNGGGGASSGGTGSGGSNAGAGGGGGASSGGAGSGGSNAGAGGAPDKCAILHPNVGTGGSGAGSQSKAATHARCYTPTPSEATLGCLPSSSPKLLEIGYLNDPLGSCGTKTLSAHGEPMPTSGTCKALADCCPEDVNPTYCAGLAAKGDERACANKLVDIPTCTLPPAETGGTLTCCYDACTTTYCVGRPIAIDGGLRLAALATRHDWA